ncbi:MAG TPA: TrbC/VirB2 family protein [Candidatus Saccharimonadales bacterium]|jgi:TRAP-type C4-dicarboxylate transport system permease small subunit
MQKTKTLKLATLFVALGAPIVLAHPALAASSSGSVSQVQTFIQSVLKVIMGLAGLVAAGFFMIGGYQYITSSGNPDHMDKAKRTLWHSALGLSIVIASFVIANIVTDLATKAFGS